MELLLSGRQLITHDPQVEGYNLSQLEKMSDVQVIKGVIHNGKQYCCSRCNNQKNFANIKGTNIYYCTHCIQLGRISTNDDLYRFPALEEIREAKESYLTWEGILSAEQERASNALVNSFKNLDKIHIIQAVTGAGKTEMIFAAIDYVLSQGGRVALVSPRVDVCLELAPRIQSAFNMVDLLILHGRMTESYRYTPLVVATNHQLLKFYRAFDLIIVDEVDAFPLAGDEGLHFGVKQALKNKGKLVYLTATPDRFLSEKIRKNEAEVTILPARFHRFPLPEPKYQWIGDWRLQITQRIQGKLLAVINNFIKEDGVKLIFMPDIKLAQKLHEWMKVLFPKLKFDVVHSKDPERIDKVQALRKGEYELLISTTILERGVTFTNCQVLIVGAEDRSYGSSALIQMSGRVGRKASHPSGQLIYAHYGISWQMVKAKRNICQMNRLARKRDLLNE